ncbi:NPC intracellular cholesterol transporter 2-like [Homarus americanus]|uniref:NPC intracellular cholesterol transporter 2-like 1 n=1 Tax=Homarus americanus TaxID=6706 RepID=A0A8J5N6U6_HOMAM|nr:NPC intracellular cholesterol transporter 2-like [Homarus americanus]KAG7174222.1 NPC intracellular cholesterol transporter 2-like 1 [Homarus americanus]
MTAHQLILLLTLLGCAAATYFQDCGSDATIDEFVLTDCDIPPCVVHRPSTQDVNITFTPVHEAKTLDTIIIANIGGLDFPWPGPNGCPLLVDDKCPINPEHTYHYHAVMPVEADYPAISAIVTWKLKDENNIVHACLVFPIVLV